MSRSRFIAFTVGLGTKSHHVPGSAVTQAEWWHVPFLSGRQKNLVLAHSAKYQRMGIMILIC